MVNLPRLNAHSSAASYAFDLNQPDPLLTFGEQLVNQGVLKKSDILRRKDNQSGQDFFVHHELGTVMAEVEAEIRDMIQKVRQEPDPPTESI